METVTRHFNNNDFLTHAISVGMTGSGKTGLSISILENARASGIPLLVFDPKGDLSNMALCRKTSDNYYEREWISRRSAVGVTDERVDAINRYPIEVMTPGSNEGKSVNLFSKLSDCDSATISALLEMLRLDSDPRSSKHHIFVSHIIDYLNKNDHAVSIVNIINCIANPPFNSLGVYPIAQVFSKKERNNMAIAFNNLLASSSFTRWSYGNPLDVHDILFNEKKEPKTTVVYLAHLDEPQRHFVISVFLNAVDRWMKRTAGATSLDKLRCLIYIDEVAGMFPPYPKNPPCKQSIMNIFKQGRAFGVGMMCSTQNTKDIDYRALSNAGIWLIGKLGTSKDRERILEGLGGHRELANEIAELKPREFVCKDRLNNYFKIRSQHTACYLKGPMTLTEIAELGFSSGDKGASFATVSTLPNKPPISIEGQDHKIKHVSLTPDKDMMSPVAIVMGMKYYYAEGEFFETICYDRVGDVVKDAKTLALNKYYYIPASVRFGAIDGIFESPARLKRFVDSIIIQEKRTRNETVYSYYNENSNTGESYQAFFDRMREKKQAEFDEFFTKVRQEGDRLMEETMKHAKTCYWTTASQVKAQAEMNAKHSVFKEMYGNPLKKLEKERLMVYRNIKERTMYPRNISITAIFIIWE